MKNEESLGIGEWLMEQRLSMNLSIREFGRRAKISYTTIAEIEKGMKPSINVLKKISDFLGVSQAYLLVMANIMEDENRKAPLIQAIIDESIKLSTKDQEEILEFIRFKRQSKIKLDK